MVGVSGLPQMKIRVSLSLKQWIKESAKRNKRSESNEVAVRLEESRAREEQKDAQQ